MVNELGVSKKNDAAPEVTNIQIKNDLLQMNHKFEELRERLDILKKRKNMSFLDIIKNVRHRIGFYKVYEAIDRLELLELYNTRL